MLVILYLVLSWISSIYGAAINAVQESVLTTAQPSGQVPIVPLESCSLAIWVSNESIAFDLVKDVKEVEEKKLYLEGQKVTCTLRKDEGVESYVDRTMDANAIIVVRVSGGSLDRKMMVRFRHEGKLFVLEPDWNSFSGCRGKEDDEEPLASFDIFGETHFLYEVVTGEVKTSSSSVEVVTTTEGGPVDPLDPLIFVIFLIVIALIVLFLMAFFVCRCCCRCAPSYKSM